MTNENDINVMEHPIVLAAIDFMVDAHRNHALKPDHELGGQRRKYSRDHYEVHPLGVAREVAKTQHNDPVTVAVAILHDVVEDTKKNLGHIREYFGKQFGNDIAANITQGVSEVTDVSKPEDGNRKVRKRIDNEHAWMASPERQTVKIADVKLNMPSIVKNDPGFARKWVAEKAEMLSGLTQPDPVLFQEVKKMVDDYFARTFKPDDWEIL